MAFTGEFKSIVRYIRKYKKGFGYIIDFGTGVYTTCESRSKAINLFLKVKEYKPEAKLFNSRGKRIL